MIRLYADEHVAKAIVKGLRQRGVDVSTIGEAGLLSTADEVLLARAQADGRVVFTHDADFLRLHSAGVGHAGIIYAAGELPVDEVIRRLMLIVPVVDSEEMKGHVEFL